MCRKSLLHRFLDFVDAIVTRFITPSGGKGRKSVDSYSVFLFVGMILAGESAFAQQIMPADKAAALRQSFPKTDIERWNKLFADPKTVLYTDAEILPAYQHANAGLLVISGGRQSIGTGRSTTFHWVGYNLSGDAQEDPKPDGLGGNANIEFPWRTPGGIAFNEAQIGKFRFFRLPDSNGRVWPVVIFRSTRNDSKMGAHEVTDWMFPIGTVFGEVLALRDRESQLHTFEVRLRIREKDYWDVEILRPFPTERDLVAELEKRGQVELATKVMSAPVRTEAMTDRLHRRQAFASEKGRVALPSFDSQLAAALLDETPFKSAVGAQWKGTAIAPTTEQAFSIVPQNYLGTHLGNDPTSCMECHRHVQRHVDSFDSVRQWYGRIRGADGIFTWHPIANRAVARSGGRIPVEIREDFIRAGWVAQFNPSVHTRERYHPLEKSK
jgi:hypothetical protein